MKTMARLLSVNVGLPRDIAWQGRTVRAAVWKEPVQGRRMVRRLNIDSDGQGDLARHGGAPSSKLCRAVRPNLLQFARPRRPAGARFRARDHPA